MQETTNYNLKKPEGTDPVNVADFNENADVIDLELSKRVESAGGDISDTKIGTADTATQEFPVPAPGDTTRGFLGKMRKFCSDFNSFKTGIITLGKLVNNGLTTQEGYALDARYGKTLLDMVTRLNSDLGEVNSNFKTKEITTGFNDLTKNGMYYLTGGKTGGDIANRPPNNDTGGWWGTCINIVHTNGVRAQIAIDVFNNRYTRMFNNGAWTAWKGFLSNTDYRRGAAMITRKPGTITSVTVNFSDPLPSTPLIFLCGNTDGPEDGVLSVSNVSAASFRINTKSVNSTGNMSVNWLAIS